MSLPFYLKGWLPAFFCFKGAEMDAVWDLVVDRPDLALFFLDGGGCQSRAQIWESEVLGRSPGRWVIADGFILFFGMGVYFDSFSSQRATGLLRLKVVLAVFFGGGGRRRGRRASVVREGSKDSYVILLFLRVLCEVRLAQLSPYPIRTCLYLSTVLYVFLA